MKQSIMLLLVMFLFALFGLQNGFSNSEVNSTIPPAYLDDKGISGLSGSVSNKYYIDRLCKSTRKIHVIGSGRHSGGVLELISPEFEIHSLKNFSCSVTLETDPGYQLLLHFHSYRISTMDSIGKCVSYLSVHENSKEIKRVCKNCTSIIINDNENNREFLISTGRTLNVTYKNPSNSNQMDQFSLTFTAFKKNVSDCQSGFLCKNLYCISSLFICDGRDNCGDWSDEDESGICRKVVTKAYGPYKKPKFIKYIKPQPGTKLTPENVWIYVTVFGVIAAIGLCYYLIKFYCKKQCYPGPPPRTAYNNWPTHTPLSTVSMYGARPNSHPGPTQVYSNTETYEGENITEYLPPSYGQVVNSHI